MYSFRFYLSDNVLISPLFLKDSFATQRNLSCQFFSFSTLNIVSYWLCPARFLMRCPLVISLGMVSRHSVHTQRSLMFGLIQAIQCGANRLMDILGRTRFQRPFGITECHMNQMSYGLNILWMFWTGPNFKDIFVWTKCLMMVLDRVKCLSRRFQGFLFS